MDYTDYTDPSVPRSWLIRVIRVIRGPILRGIPQWHVGLGVVDDGLVVGVGQPNAVFATIMCGDVGAVARGILVVGGAFWR